MGHPAQQVCPGERACGSGRRVAGAWGMRAESIRAVGRSATAEGFCQEGGHDEGAVEGEDEPAHGAWHGRGEGGSGAA